MSAEVITRAVSDVLGIPVPSAGDNFLDLGGSSLAAVQVVVRVERVTGVRLDPRDLLSSDTLDAIGQLLGSGTVDRSPSRPEARLTGRDRSRASLAQQWALDAARAEPLAPTLQFHVAYQVRGPLDVTRLQAAVHQVVRHHPALRVVLRRAGDHDEMVVVDPDSLWAVEDASADEDLRLQRMTAFASAPFPPGEAARLRVLVLRAAPDLHDLCLSFDHRVADGWSLRVVLEDLGNAYGQLVAGQEVALPAAGSYLDFAEAEWSAAEKRIQRAVDHWSRVLPDSYRDFPLALPGHRPGLPLRDPRHLSQRLDSAVGAALAATQAATRASAFAVSTAAMARAVAELTEREEVRILTSSANRDHPGHERTVGWFANGIFPTYRMGVQALASDVAEVSAVAAAADAVGDVPASYVRRRLWPDAPRGFRQDTGVYFACNQAWTEPLVLLDCRLTAVPLKDRADAPGLQFHLLRHGADWVLNTYFHGSEYDASVTHALVDQFCHVLLRQDATV